MEGFATGFNLEGNTKPGFSVENDGFKLTFEGVSCDDRKNIVSHGFECCYDWSAVMNMIIEATEHYDSMVDVEEKTEKVLRKWLTTFHGWGLLSSMLPTEKHRYFILSLAYASANWNEATGGPYSTEKIFDTVKYVYENCPGKEIHHLVPRLGAWFEEIIEDEAGTKSNERMKSFTICFNAKWMLDVKFVFEKKRVNRNLLDFAAEAVANQMNIEDDIDNLVIPPTLFDDVYDKFKDVEWVRSYWNFKSDLEYPETEIDEEEFAAILEEVDNVLEETNEEIMVQSKDVGNQITERDQKTEHSEELYEDSTYVSDEYLAVKCTDLVFSTDHPSPARESKTEEQKGFDFASGWGALYIFIVIFAYLCA